MKQLHFPWHWSFIILSCLLLQSGCASKIPRTISIVERDKPVILERIAELYNRPCPTAVDADVTLRWLTLIQKENIPGILQLQSPAYMRVSIVDPLGRQLYILVSDGQSFTLVDNLNAKALQGSVHSHFWQQYLPDFIAPKEYLSWLTARLTPDLLHVQDLRRDSGQSENIWLISGWQNRIRHHVLISPQALLVKRHIVEDEDGSILLDAIYDDYGKTDSLCPLPGKITIAGSAISGTLQLMFDEYFPVEQIPLKSFRLELPEHFTARHVD